MRTAGQNIIGDRMTYMVIHTHKSGPFNAERDVADMSRMSIVNDIASGELGDVLQVIAFNPVEHVCDDVTEAVMREAAEAIITDTHADDFSDWQRNFVEQVMGLEAMREHERDCREEAAHRRTLRSVA